MNSANRPTDKVKPALLYSATRGCRGVTAVLLLKEVAPHLGIHGAERVVQQVDVCVLIYGSGRMVRIRCGEFISLVTISRVKTSAARYSTPGQADPGLLTSTEVGPSVPHHRQITTWQHVQILNRVQMQPLFTITG